jgi:hypothetical protein
MSQTNSLSCAETAKLVRQALKESFPGVKFAVQSSVYSGGASITVRWTDGPAAKVVETITSKFEGAYFDGMIDYKGSKKSLLDGKPARFGADIIFETRTSSDRQIARAIAFLQAKYPNNGIEATVEAFKAGSLYATYPLGGDWATTNSLQSMINVTLSKFSTVVRPGPSPTVRRVQCIGDDGYGAGTVGPYFTGGGKGYAAVNS